ncbi:hypothetical protein P7C70_g703, partial [Phenoliferia sp. Uapishka_3]
MTVGNTREPTLGDSQRRQEIPRFGLGVYGAEWYENEADCGRAINDFIKQSGVPRSEIFHATELMANKTTEWVHEAIAISLKKAELDYADAYLVHGPAGGPEVRAATGGVLRNQELGSRQILWSIKKSPAQILIRYGLDRGFVVIPKSTKKERIVDNANVFDFTLEMGDVEKLTSLDEFLITDWEATTVP